ncbi:MAG: methionine--tRNA ligase [Candidatus Pacebacteria bacterium]|jgi:methionyl-tRNA synthetase|nr:methionine--tRNA ligase [bacterium]MDP6527401.1 methionine--tRNA ligase [Candidatus Paceibacterota bacterium]MDP6659527.1 methionine--tRNA ligase [Candidatus Paceibacterota bacterium]|tara:strand:- start:20730 stop:22160 length:1431 start_codon:yes stop_codon:yes gene_type:complete
MEKKKFYITTTIPYVNADPHIGFALEAVQADVLARHYRNLQHEVFHNAGTDEHGQKIWEEAENSGENVQKYVDRHVESVEKLKEILNLNYDNFIRTTDEAHKAAAQELWRLCKENGDIYKAKHKGLYCVGCEKFLTERDLEDGKCPIHPNKEPVVLEEENWFFKLKKYESFLKKYLSKQDVIIPEHRLKEAQLFVENGLEDFSISREKEKLPWGVPVPDDDTQTMYVWFDALTNYISTLGWPEDKEGKYKKFWEEGATIQLAGKDQIRFQSIMWPAMLKSAGLPAPKQIFYHGFINSGGQRMSKSIGNVIEPKDLVERYGTDATRYLLLRHIHPTDDTDVTWEKLDEWYEANLVNGLGNLVARVLKLSETHLENPVKVDEEFERLPKEFISNFSFNEAMDEIWRLFSNIDLHITTTEPYKQIKEDPSKAMSDIEVAVKSLWKWSLWLEPFLPETSEKIQRAIEENKKPENLFERKE